MAQVYYTPYTIAGGQVPSSQSGFPALVYASDARFKTIANGGHVVTGNDIRPYSDSALTTALTYQMELYDGVNGIWIGWVNITAANGLVIYLGYGDAALNTDGSSSSTWDTDYLGVYHLGDGSSLSLVDSSQSARTLSSSGSPTATAGKINGAVNLVAGSAQYLNLTSYSTGANNVSLEAWVNSATLNSGNMMILEKSTVNSQWELFVEGGSVKLRGGNFTNTLTTAAPSNSAWHHIVGTINGTSGAIYIDGTATTGTVDAFTDNSSTFYVGTYDGGSYLFDGKIDEIHVSKIARSANWVATEYNNQNAPNTFWTMGTEVVVGATIIYVVSTMTIPLPAPRRTQIIMI